MHRSAYCSVAKRAWQETCFSHLHALDYQTAGSFYLCNAARMHSPQASTIAMFGMQCCMPSYIKLCVCIAQYCIVFVTNTNTRSVTHTHICTANSCASGAYERSFMEPAFEQLTHAILAPDKDMQLVPGVQFKYSSSCCPSNAHPSVF